MQFLTVNEVAEKLQVHPRTVKRWLNDGKLKGVLLGDRAGWRVSTKQFEEFVDEQLRATEDVIEAKPAA
jgi:excisionase family DNA binding protein